MNYSLGLDIGITSIGWAVLDFDRNKIENLGVRIFDKAEQPKTGAPLALPRREAAGARRRTHRKAKRIKDIKKLIAAKGILTENELTELYHNPTFEKTPWQLRADGLDRLLTNTEWARLLIHIAKHRGFKSNRINEEAADAEAGKMKQGMNENSKLLASGKYRTIGEAIEKDAKFAAHKRNKAGDYSNTVKRAELEAEISILFNAQRELGSRFADEETEAEYLTIWGYQLPFASGSDIENKVGFCSLEPTHHRAPKASFTSERFMLLAKITNLRVRVNGKKYELSLDKKQIIENLAYKNAKVTYTQIRKAFAEFEPFEFDTLPYTKGAKKPEDAVFVELKSFHKFKSAITNVLGKEYWQTLFTTNPYILDVIARGLAYYKDDSEIEKYLTANGVEPSLVAAVLPLNFSGFAKYSTEAMTKLLEYMETGADEYTARVMAGYESGAEDEEARCTLLPIPEWETLHNPVVLRAVSQTRKVVNAIIRKYGSPTYIQIELARDLSKSFDERREIEKEQKTNQADKEKLSENFKALFGYDPKPYQLEQFRLWKEQGGFCPYTGQYMEPGEIFGDPNSYCVEVDHILPYSRSFNNSFTNKVLVFRHANQNKGNKTPYEWLGNDKEKWAEFTARVDANVKPHNARRAANLKSVDFTKEEETMKDRSLNDTRYITRFIANWIESTLKFADCEVKRPVTRINGSATAVMRKYWGINSLKDRTASDIHHALDACVIGAATPSIIKRISDYSRRKELNLLKQEENETGKKPKLPEPWENFRKEIEARISENPSEKLTEFNLSAYTSDEIAEAKPVFISKAPRRKVTGSGHEETIRSTKYIETDGCTVKTKHLAELTLKDLESMVGRERDRRLYKALKEQLEAHKGKGEVAFKDVFHKPTKDGSLGPVVRSIKIMTSDAVNSGVRVRGGVAKNGEMAKVVVYEKDGNFFLVPYYVGDIAAHLFKDRAVKGEKIDDSYNYHFTLYRNDLVKVVKKSGEIIFGYYSSCDIATASIAIKDPNCNTKEWRGIGVKTLALFEKYEVDVLGNYHQIKHEAKPNGVA